MKMGLCTCVLCMPVMLLYFKIVLDVTRIISSETFLCIEKKQTTEDQSGLTSKNH